MTAKLQRHEQWRFFLVEAKKCPGGSRCDFVVQVQAWTAYEAKEKVKALGYTGIGKAYPA